jgi:hypothetical protein
MEIINKVQSSGLLSLDLEEFYPEGDRVVLDIKEQLFMGMILKEKEFREFIKNTDWSNYAGKHVSLFCSVDAVIPTWAYMLISNKLSPYASSIHFGTLQQMEENLILEAIRTRVKVEEYKDAKVVIKGCGKLGIGNAAYIEITRILSPVVQSLMFGEPCSTVPVYKRRN